MHTPAGDPVLAGLRDTGRRIEGDPVLQYKIHKIMARVWLVVTFPLLAVAIFLPHVWLVVGVAYVMVASNYANWATDQGASAAANASTSESITAFDAAKAAENQAGLTPGAAGGAAWRFRYLRVG